MGCGSSFSKNQSIKDPNEKINILKALKFTSNGKLPPLETKKTSNKKQKEINFEPFTLLCFHELFNETNQLPFGKLIDFTCYFNNLKECEQFISNQTSNSYLFVILSRKTFPDLISYLHDLNQILLIYIFDQNHQRIDQHWTKRYPKLKGIYFDEESLFEQLSMDIEIYLNLFDLIPINIYSRLEINQMNPNCSDHLRFLFYHLFFYEYSLNSPTKLNSDEFLNLIESYYSNNRSQLKQIKKFSNEFDYSSWLIENTFIRRILTESLLNFNIQLLISMRFIFKDFHKLIIENLSKQRLISNKKTFYRAQILNKQTFIRIKSNIGELLSMNNLIFASENRQEMLDYLTDNIRSNENFHRILFEINIPWNYSLEKQRPWIYLKSLNQKSEIYSILFYFGSIFRINRIDFDLTHNCSIIQLTLYDENSNDDFQQIFSFIKNFQITNKQNLFDLANILRQISSNAGEKFYEYLIKTHYQTFECYHGLGLCLYSQENYQDALTYFQKALKLNSNNQLNCSSLHNNIGLIYAKQNQIDQALEHFNKALDYSSIPIHISCIHFNLALIYNQQGQIQKELQHYQTALQIRTKQFPNEHLQMANLYNNIGIAYSEINDYDRALFNLRKALQIRLKYLSEIHIDVARNYVNIGNVYTKTQELTMALDYFNKAKILFEKQQIISQNDIQQLNNNIQIVNDKLRRKTC